MSTYTTIPVRSRFVVALLSIGLVLGLLVGSANAVIRPSAEITVAGIEQDALLGAAELEALEVVVGSDIPEALDAAELTLDGETVTPEVSPAGLRWAPEGDALADGEHSLHLVVPQPFPARDVRERFRFTVDATPPEVELADLPEVAPPGTEVTIEGTVEDGAVVTVDGAEVASADGAFRTDMAARPEPVQVVAADAAGNRTVVDVQIPVVPSRVRAETVRSVHVSFYGWAVPELREPVLQMAREGRINSVQLDLKDESGTVGYASQVPRANEIGATDPIYDLAAAVQELHDLGVHVIGRIVAFRDPVLATHAWESGQREQVIQNPDGSQYAGYGGFTNAANADVRQYNIDLAVEAAQHGVDDILWDYVRRPDGNVANMVLPGLEGTPEQAIVDFLAQADAVLRPYGVHHGASVYGIAVTRPTEIAQDIPAMAAHLDYVAPMVYPSHWAPGEYDVSNPNAEPYPITLGSVRDFVETVAGTRARVVPWLQDFSLGVTYGEAEVRAQIDASREAGTDEWIMWDPKVTYTSSAFDPMSDVPAAPQEPGEPGEPGGDAEADAAAASDG